MGYSSSDEYIQISKQCAIQVSKKRNNFLPTNVRVSQFAIVSNYRSKKKISCLHGSVSPSETLYLPFYRTPVFEEQDDTKDGCLTLIRI
jgi:hypothetical protein